MSGEGVSVARRAVLAGATAAFGGIGGCSNVIGGRGDAPPVSMLVAGSLNAALENGLRPRTDARLQVEAHGSARVARLVAAGQKEPDIVSVADVALFTAPLSPSWFAEFATNSLVVAYDPDAPGGQLLADAGRDTWYRPLLDGDVALGRTDPVLDPLGYRTLFLFDLATDHYGTTVNLRKAIPAPEQVYPETQLISQFETGAIDAAVTYRNMAVERGYAYIDLPAAIDLSDPAYAAQYATTSYELPNGTVVTGDVISYASTARRAAPAVDAVFDRHVTGSYLTDYGFVVPDDYPRYTGDVPDRVAT